LSVLCSTRKQLKQALALGAGAAACASGLAFAAGNPSLHTSRGCYLVGQRVGVRGSGFAPSRFYVLTIDGVYFGQASTDSNGSFSPNVLPGGLPAGVPQAVELLEASDGSRGASTRFTLTRPAGARFLHVTGSGSSLKAPIEVWGFSPTGARRTVYLHYVTPSGSARSTVKLGQTGGQCGYLRTARRPVFPFSITPGTWTFQVDTRSQYSRHPGTPVSRIRVTVH
jgi:hypothetical protein